MGGLAPDRSASLPELNVSTSSLMTTQPAITSEVFPLFPFRDINIHFFQPSMNALVKPPKESRRAAKDIYHQHMSSGVL